MKFFVEPALEVKMFAVEDIITTSVAEGPTPELGETERD